MVSNEKCGAAPEMALVGQWKSGGALSPAGGCPAGYWHSLEPVDVDTNPGRRESARITRDRELVKPVILMALSRMSDVKQRKAFLAECLVKSACHLRAVLDCLEEQGLVVEDL